MSIVVRYVIEIVFVADLAHLRTRVIVPECFGDDRRLLRQKASGQEQKRRNPGYSGIAATIEASIEHAYGHRSTAIPLRCGIAGPFVSI